MDNASYLNLLSKKDGVIDSIKNKLKEAKMDSNFIYVQDNAPHHMKVDKTKNVAYVLDFFDKRKIRYISDWPALSPDLNPIEKMWSLTQVELDKLLINTKPRNERQLFTLIKKAWNSIKNDVAIRIYNTFISNCQFVIDNEGKNNFRG